MPENTFTLADLQLLEDAVLCLNTETSRRLQDQDRVPASNPVVTSQINQTRTELRTRIDKLALLRAKLITERDALSQPAESEPEEENSES